MRLAVVVLGLVLISTGPSLAQAGPGSATKALAQMQSADAATRRAGVSLAATCPRGDGPRLAAALVRALQDSDNMVRLTAVSAIQHFGPRVAAAVPLLCALLKHPPIPEGHATSETPHVESPGVMAGQEEVLGALGAIGHDAASAVPSVLAVGRALPPPDQFPRLLENAVLTALYDIADAHAPSAAEAKTWVKARLTESDLENRYTAAFAYWRLGGPPSVALNVLTESLNAQNFDMSQGTVAAHFLAQMRQAAAPAIPALIAAARAHADRVSLLRTALRLGARPVDVMPVLLPALKLTAESPQNEISPAQEALLTIVMMGPQASAAVPSVEPLLQGPLAPLAALTLVRLDPTRVDRDPRILQALAGQMGDGPPDIWCTGLLWLGPRARPLFPQLEKMLDHDDLNVRLSAGTVILSFDPTNAAARGALLKSRMQLVMALNDLVYDPTEGQDSDEPEFLSHEAETVFLTALVRACGCLGADAAPFEPALARMAKENIDLAMRSAATSALARLKGKP